ncbi:hypothetical protein K8S17_05455 [bacterium]|nr:hypothetical protein [bacterium]
MKELKGLRWEPLWVSHLGCLKGCLNYLGIEMSAAWLFGASGHAFMLNVGRDVCSSGPTAWKSNVLLTLGSSVGFRTIVVFGFRGNGDLDDAQERAWNAAQRAVDDGIPCYAWELDAPEFYVVYGYDEAGYYYQGCTAPDGRGPKPWRELGDTGIGCVELVVVHPQEPRDDATVVRGALTFATAVADGGQEWVLPGYAMGFAAYDEWIEGLRSRKASGVGAAYNASVWESCRRHAVAFLREAKGRLPGVADTAFSQAIDAYGIVATHLGWVAETFPFVDTSNDAREANVKDEEKIAAAIEHLRCARDAELEGAKGLAIIASHLA